MKTKRIKTKLRLSKTTVATVGSEKLNRIIGGTPSIGTFCATCWGENCDTVSLSLNPPVICQDTSICDTQLTLICSIEPC